MSKIFHGILLLATLVPRTFNRVIHIPYTLKELIFAWTNFRGTIHFCVNIFDCSHLGKKYPNISFLKSCLKISSTKYSNSMPSESENWFP